MPAHVYVRKTVLLIDKMALSLGIFLRCIGFLSFVILATASTQIGSEKVSRHPLP
jgi:hypothetical protein